MCSSIWKGIRSFDEGLEYLFGFVHVVAGRPVFVPFWGHTRAEEKRAFEEAMDFIMGRLGIPRCLCVSLRKL